MEIDGYCEKNKFFTFSKILEIFSLSVQVQVKFVKIENVITQKFHQKCQMGNKNAEFDADLKFVEVVSK
jgi:hypothetical protein